VGIKPLDVGRNALTGINRILTPVVDGWYGPWLGCRNALTGINRILTPVVDGWYGPWLGCRNALTGINRILTGERSARGNRATADVVMPLRALIGF